MSATFLFLKRWTAGLLPYGELRWGMNKKEGNTMTRQVFMIGILMLSNSWVVLAGETITALEEEGYFYADGEMKELQRIV